MSYKLKISNYSQKIISKGHFSFNFFLYTKGVTVKKFDFEFSVDISAFEPPEM